MMRWRKKMWRGRKKRRGCIFRNNNQGENVEKEEDDEVEKEDVEGEKEDVEGVGGRKRRGCIFRNDN